MLNKTDYEEPASVAVKPEKKGNGKVVKASAAEDSPVSIAAKNEDIPVAEPDSVSVFGSTLVFKGELSADEEILIQGTVEGKIAHHKKNVTIGKQGRVIAFIHAHSVTIQGRVDGDIHSDVIVVLEKGCEVNGNIFCPCIRMEEGARFDGTIKMS